MAAVIHETAFIHPQDIWRAFLRGPGNALDAVGDYSSTAATWEAEVTGNETIIVCTIVMCMAYSGKFDILQYGTISGGLTNGIRISVTQAWQTYYLDGDEPIKTNFDWAVLASGGAAVQPDEAASKNDQGFYGLGINMSRWGRPIALRTGDFFRMTFNDDLRGGITPTMLRHRFLISGYAADASMMPE